MLMKLPDSWRGWTVFTVALILLVLIVGSSQPFQTCIEEATKYYGSEALQKGTPNIFVVLKTFKSCLGVYIIEKNAVITALATLAIAYFTWTIWDINRSQLRHNRQVERAYISGGGGYAIDTRGVPPVVDRTQFVLTVQNYGKTPGTVRAYAVFVVDRANLPREPAYLAQGFVPTQFHGVYQLGGPTLPITQVPVSPGPNPIAYGRLWYTDIFDGEHYFSFALPIQNPADHSTLVGIHRAYTEST
jgi:hypothetical protein